MNNVIVIILNILLFSINSNGQLLEYDDIITSSLNTNGDFNEILIFDKPLESDVKSNKSYLVEKYKLDTTGRISSHVYFYSDGNVLSSIVKDSFQYDSKNRIIRTLKYKPVKKFLLSSNIKKRIRTHHRIRKLKWGEQILDHKIVYNDRNSTFENEVECIKDKNDVIIRKFKYERNMDDSLIIKYTAESPNFNFVLSDSIVKTNDTIFHYIHPSDELKSVLIYNKFENRAYLSKLKVGDIYFDHFYNKSGQLEKIVSLDNSIETIFVYDGNVIRKTIVSIDAVKINETHRRYN